jgi:hypothetical protein
VHYENRHHAGICAGAGDEFGYLPGDLVQPLTARSGLDDRL